MKSRKIFFSYTDTKDCMVYINGLRPRATKDQLEFMKKYNLPYRKHVTKGELILVIRKFTKEWTKERLEAENVPYLSVNKERAAYGFLRDERNKTMGTREFRINELVIHRGKTAKLLAMFSNGVVEIELEGNNVVVKFGEIANV